jgi:hypothetical protein
MPLSTHSPHPCRRSDQRVAAAADRRHQRKEQKELLEELLPRATGGTREARVRRIGQVLAVSTVCAVMRAVWFGGMEPASDLSVLLLQRSSSQVVGWVARMFVCCPQGQNCKAGLAAQLLVVGLAAGCSAANQRWPASQPLAPPKRPCMQCSAVLCVALQVEARLARREEAKAREESPDLMAAGGAHIMGGDDSFAAAKARWGVGQCALELSSVLCDPLVHQVVSGMIWSSPTQRLQHAWMLKQYVVMSCHVMSCHHVMH